MILSNDCQGDIYSEVSGENIKEISPNDTAIFEIKVKNYGGMTNIEFNIESIPEGWSAHIIDNARMYVESEKTVLLFVNPPDNFGFHDDSATIHIVITDNGSEPIYHSFAVNSRGFSFAGVEIILPLIVCVTAVMVLIVIFKKRKK